MNDPKKFWREYKMLPVKAWGSLLGGILGSVLVGSFFRFTIALVMPESVAGPLIEGVGGAVALIGFLAFIYFMFLYRNASCPYCTHTQFNLLNVLIPISPWCRYCGKRVDGGPLFKFRKPNEYEKRIFKRLVEGQFDGQNEIAEQLQDCLVQQLTDCPVPSLNIKTNASAIANIRKNPPTEGSSKRSDGSVIEFLLHVRDGKAVMLEVVTYNENEKFDPKPIPEDLELFQPYSSVNGVPR